MLGISHSYKAQGPFQFPKGAGYYIAQANYHSYLWGSHGQEQTVEWDHVSTKLSLSRAKSRVEAIVLIKLERLLNQYEGEKNKRFPHPQ